MVLRGPAENKPRPRPIFESSRRKSSKTSTTTPPDIPRARSAPPASLRRAVLIATSLIPTVWQSIPRRTLRRWRHASRGRKAAGSKAASVAITAKTPANESLGERDPRRNCFAPAERRPDPQLVATGRECGSDAPRENRNRSDSDPIEGPSDSPESHTSADSPTAVMRHFRYPQTCPLGLTQVVIGQSDQSGRSGDRAARTVWGINEPDRSTVGTWVPERASPNLSRLRSSSPSRS